MVVSHDLEDVVAMLSELSDYVKHLFEWRVRLHALQEGQVQIITHWERKQC